MVRPHWFESWHIRKRCVGLATEQQRQAIACLADRVGRRVVVYRLRAIDLRGRQRLGMKIFDGKYSDFPVSSDPSGTISQSCSVTQHRHCSTGKPEHTQPKQDGWRDGSTAPVFTLGDEPIGWSVLFVASTGDDIDFEAVGSFSAIS